ncbi:aspartyl protease family protein [Sphingomonas faeni]|uniref:aspartyl protease family protein n=1 Tax=Sphingomonas faeni TaxID=185950 RepID=UPI002787FB79|nr:aspartyl protease family protein [Sphingomonas faeni]MDQ0837033.1 hypothetical protein [Sphingomonas faeni]
MSRYSVLVRLAAVVPFIMGAAPQTHDAIDETLAANRSATAPQGCAWNGTLEQDLRSIDPDAPTILHSVMDRRTGRYANWQSTGPMRTGEGFDGRMPWQQEVSGTVRPEAGGEMPALAISEAYRGANAWWATDRAGAAISDAGPVVESGRRYARLTVTPLRGQTFTAWFDVNTHLLAQVTQKIGAATTTTVYSEYRNVGGCLYAGSMTIDGGDGEQYRQTFTLIRTKSSKTLPRRYFSPPKTDPKDFAFGALGSTSVPFWLEGNHVLFDARINGKGPFTMILDTGGLAVLTVATAKTLAVRATGNTAVGGIGDKVESSGYVHGLDVQIGEFMLHGQTAMVLDLPNTPPPARAMQGMMGYELLRRVIVKIDYRTNILTLSDPKKFDRKRAGIAVPFDYADHMPEVAGSFEGIKGRFRIDTGSGSELVVSSPAVQQHGLRKCHPVGVQRTSGSGIGGTTTAYMTRSDDLKIGAIRFDHFVANLSSQKIGAFADPSYTGNIGGGLLKRYVVTFDYPGQTIYFQRRPDVVDDTGTYERAGISIQAVASGLAIGEVVAGGPAEAAGLRAGDVLSAVDGAKSAVTDLSGLRYRLRNAPVGTAVTFDVLRGTTKISKTIILKDQI